MSKRLYLRFAGPLGAILAAAPLFGQVPAKSSPTTASSTAVEHAIDLAAKGRCQEALPVLKKSLAQASDKPLEYRVAMATARCAMSLDQMTAVAPTSYQSRELEAESLESRENWDAAANEYRKILEQNPNLPGIHFRMGRVALSRVESPSNTEEARKEFQEELKIDPNNAASEFWLGEIARRVGEWNQAISHFTNASKLDSGFAEAYLALGMSLNSAERFPEAVAPLERYVKMVEADAAGHYQLSMAYARTGRKEDAAREMAIQQQISEKNPGGVRP